MDYGTRKRLLFVVNPLAGQLRALREMSQIVRLFCDAGLCVTVHTTSCRGDARSVVAQTCSQYDIVACCGGDGTLNEVLSGIIDSKADVPVGYIPCGTTNDFAATLGLSTDMMKSAQNILDGVPTPYDLGSFGEDRYFSYVSSFGAFTRASYATTQKAKNAIGHLAYLLEGIKSIGDIRPFHVAVTHDGIREEGDYIFGAVTNSTSLGGVMNLSKDSVNLHDGLLELMLVRKPANMNKISRIIYEVLTYRYDGDNVALYHGRDFLFESAEELSWTLDGESGGSRLVTPVRCLPDSVKLIVPAQ